MAPQPCHKQTKEKWTWDDGSFFLLFFLFYCLKKLTHRDTLSNYGFEVTGGQYKYYNGQLAPPFRAMSSSYNLIGKSALPERCHSFRTSPIFVSPPTNFIIKWARSRTSTREQTDICVCCFLLPREFLHLLHRKIENEYVAFIFFP